MTNLAATSAGASCPACGAGVPAEARFCPACGERLVGGVDERRVLTALFADLVDSTSLVEALDPEAARDLLSETFRRLAAEVRRFGGTLEKYIGDAIFAVFGFPTGHDDDAARAVRAALAMRDIVKTAETALGDLPLHLRIGLDTGEVAAGAGSGDLRVTGPAVHSAARIQQAAEPDQILASARTLRAAGIELDPLRRIATRDGRQLDQDSVRCATLAARHALNPPVRSRGPSPSTIRANRLPPREMSLRPRPQSRTRPPLV